MPRYEFSQGASRKFWEVERDGAAITLRWGRIGTEGQSKIKVSASEEAAQTELERLTRAKVAKGYVAVETAKGIVATSRLSEPELKRIAAEHACRAGEDIPGAIERGNAWLRALLDGGYGSLLQAEYSYKKLSREAVVRSSEPASEAEVAALESALGFPLPSSYRAYLLQVGGLSFLNYWWDETTPVDMLVEESLRVRNQVAAQGSKPSPLLEACTPLQLIRFCDFHNHAGEFIFICNFRDEFGECPEFLWFHDDAFGGQADLEWVKRVERRVTKLADKNVASAEGGTHAVMTAFTRRVDHLLASELTQREKLRDLGGLLADLSSASDAELLTTLHAIRKAINSKKLIESRDALIEDLRRDGEPGRAPLPPLLREAHAPPRPSPSESFSTFDDWLSGHVDRMIEEATESLAERLVGKSSEA